MEMINGLSIKNHEIRLDLTYDVFEVHRELHEVVLVQVALEEVSMRWCIFVYALF
jgi:hypothetical protein